MSKNQKGVIVITKSGKTGRTYNSKPHINGKVPIYLEKNTGKMDWGETAILCEPTSLRLTGYID